jgi:diadenosine tetraphosphate (Ap4A) HIT family hydrolase
MQYLPSPEVSLMKVPMVLASQYSIAIPCIDTDVPGYLVLRAKVEQQRLYETPLSFQREIGVMLAKLEYAITSVTGAQHVYIARFSEALASVHFHLFPRTAAIAVEFLRENPGEKGSVNAPLLFDWARRKYHVDKLEQLSAATIAAAEQIRTVCGARRLRPNGEAPGRP